MRRLAFAIGLALACGGGQAEDSPGLQAVTVAELREMVTSGQLHGDKEAAHRLSGLKLTERLSDPTQAALANGLPGRQAREELQVLAKESAFLDPPLSESASAPQPDIATQKIFFVLLLDYMNKTVAQWPDFTVRRVSRRLEGTAENIPSDLQDNLFSSDGKTLRSPVAKDWECRFQHKGDHRRLSVLDKVKITVLYRNGKAVHTPSPGAGEFACTEGGMSSSDDFVEATILIPLIAKHGRVQWSHWERGEHALWAVFRYALNLAYQGPRAYLSSLDGREPLKIEIHGTFATDISDGSLRRITELRHWQEGAFPTDYNTVIEFAPTTLSGRSLVLPVRRVSVYRTPLLRPPGVSPETDALYRKFHLSQSPLQEYVNDVSFLEYRLYDGGR